ncbi:hypothetical protein CPB83DRAFT_901452 [Crepidotus variabilis]|uniref:Dihydroorotate oxidase n=1 Tax=Crepidotus variabilis TaxID=179855 RepID=A0A9P6JVS0_9AGAR|nr:hypothetical protein CPB83DRAFT_901452 [Crepidotus variabilis]
MVLINWISISPPLLNSSCAWSSDRTQLTELYESPYTGAVTTRSATLEGFKEDYTHTVAFTNDSLTSINAYGYSPHPLSKYLEWVEEILTSHPNSTKPIIISVATAEPKVLQKMLGDIQALRHKLLDNQAPKGKARIAVELNTSCPNFPDAVPPAYDPIDKMFPLLLMAADTFVEDYTLTIGVKLPPYLMREQFAHCVHGFVPLVSTLDGERRSAISFVTSINTVGNAMLPSSLAKPIALVDKSEAPDTPKPPSKELEASSSTSTQGDNGREHNLPNGGDSSKGNQTETAHRLFMSNLFPKPSDPSQYALPGAYGGLGGEAIHAIALGNVYSFRQIIDSDMLVRSGLSGIKIIGVGGVTSKDAVGRMKAAGADAVACATFFGKNGVKAFEILGKE